LECSMPGCLWKEKEKHHFHLLPLFTQKYFTSTFFPLILGFFFIMVLNHYFVSFLHFPWPINCNHTFRYIKFSTHSSPSWFWSKIFFHSLNSWCRAWPCFMGFK
jgi:hypothetical protein